MPAHPINEDGTEDFSWDQERQSTESAFVAFTQLWMSGISWNVTLREGMTHERVDALFDLLQYASTQALAHNASVRPGEMPVRETPEASYAASSTTSTAQPHTQPAGAAPDGSEQPRNRPANGVERIVRIEVGGTLESPQVKMWSGNQKLQFPFMTPTSQIVLDLLAQQDFDVSQPGIRKLTQPGVVINVQWDVTWVKSPKNDKWKDITGIKVLPKEVSPI